MQEEDAIGVGALDCKWETVVIGQLIGGLDAHFAAMETVRRFERHELDLRPAVCRYVNRLALQHLAVQDQGHVLLHRGGVEAGHDGLHTGLLGIVDTAGSGDAFDDPVGLVVVSHGVNHEVGVVREAQIDEGRRHGRLLHVAEEMHLHGTVRGFGDGAERAGQFGVGAASIGRLYGLHGGA